MRTRCWFLFLILVVCSLHSNATDKDSVEVMKSVSVFVTAFNNLEWKTFRASFSDDATIFYPSWEQVKRVSGRNDIEATWVTIFPEFLDPNNTFKLKIEPKDIRVQLYGNTAIVTFHLGEGVKSLSRRTLVMVKQKQGWKIVHLHASEFSEG